MGPVRLVVIDEYDFPSRSHRLEQGIDPSALVEIGHLVQQAVT